MKTTMTITVPTTTPGEVAVFTISFLKSKFDEVVETVGLLVKPTDVALVEADGLWAIINN